MKSANLKFLTNENVHFNLNFDEIACKISQILPFSKVIMLLTDDEFFDLGKDLFNKLSFLGLNVINIIYNKNIVNQTQDLINGYSFEDVRGIIVFSKKVLLTLRQHCLKVKKLFYVQKDADTYGVFFNFNHITEEKQTTYFFNEDLFNEEYARKSFAIKIVHLIDYAFRNNLFAKRVDTLFFSNQKKKLVGALIEIEQFKNKQKTLFLKDLELDYMFCSSFYPLSSINVCSFLYCKDFFDFESAYYFSIKVIRKIKNFFSGQLNDEKIDYIERAKIVRFLTNDDINQILKDIKSQTENIQDGNINALKQQVKKLVLIYQDFCMRLNTSKSFNEQLATTCLSVSGDTKFSINNSTAFREILFK